MTPNVIKTRDERSNSLPTPAFNNITDGDGFATAKATLEHNSPLFAAHDAQDFRSRWEKIQSEFVDEPRNAVEKADELVGSVMKRLEELFAVERQKPAGQGEMTGSVSTEDLRLALRRYRFFLDRLLSV